MFVNLYKDWGEHWVLDTRDGVVEKWRGGDLHDLVAKTGIQIVGFNTKADMRYPLRKVHCKNGDKCVVSVLGEFYNNEYWVNIHYVECINGEFNLDDCKCDNIVVCKHSDLSEYRLCTWDNGRSYTCFELQGVDTNNDYQERWCNYDIVKWFTKDSPYNLRLDSFDWLAGDFVCSIAKNGCVVIGE